MSSGWHDEVHINSIRAISFVKKERGKKKADFNPQIKIIKSILERLGFPPANLQRDVFTIETGCGAIPPCKSVNVRWELEVEVKQEPGSLPLLCRVSGYRNEMRMCVCIYKGVYKTTQLYKYIYLGVNVM